MLINSSWPTTWQTAQIATQVLLQHPNPLSAGVNVSPTCVAELEAFKVDRAANINKDIPLGAAL